MVDDVEIAEKESDDSEDLDEGKTGLEGEHLKFVLIIYLQLLVQTT